jgi:hypothetical protein
VIGAVNITANKAWSGNNEIWTLGSADVGATDTRGNYPVRFVPNEEGRSIISYIRELDGINRGREYSNRMKG